MTEFYARLDSSGVMPVIRVSGPLVYGEHLEQLRNLVNRLATEGNNRIVLDVANVELIDSTGISTLIGIKQRAGANGRVTLLRPTARLRSALTMIRATTLFEMVDDESQL
jgi:anti-sigma B factor antagonist